MRCDECGFAYDALPRGLLPARLAGLGERYRAALRGPDAALRRRPAPDVWSALEYTCHVRDVLRVQHDRLRSALTRDEPVFAPMRRDERVISDRYAAQDPGRVLDELAAAGATLADDFAGLTGAQWMRTGVYPWPAPQPRSMDWLARHTVHEGEHHLLDLARCLDQPGPRESTTL